MADEIDWLTPDEEAALDLARAEAAAEAPSTPEEDAELERDCAAAAAWRLAWERSKHGDEEKSD